MTATIATPPTVAAAAPTVRARRRPAVILLGVALIALCGLGGAWLATSGAKTSPVVVARAGLTAGQPVTESDLAITQIAGGAGVAVVPGDQARSLVGKIPVNDIPAGALIAPAQLVGALTPGPGKSIVGIPVKHGQLPSIGLRAGDQVLLVVTASPGAAAGSAPVKPGTSWAGVVVAVGDPADDLSRTVDVVVDQAQAIDVATAAGTNAIALILQGR